MNGSVSKVAPPSRIARRQRGNISSLRPSASLMVNFDSSSRSRCSRFPRNNTGCSDAGARKPRRDRRVASLEKFTNHRDDCLHSRKVICTTLSQQLLARAPVEHGFDAFRELPGLPDVMMQTLAVGALVFVFEQV